MANVRRHDGPLKLLLGIGIGVQESMDLREVRTFLPFMLRAPSPMAFLVA